MLQNKQWNVLLYSGICIFLLLFIFSSCSNKKNTAVTRAYHSINTHYNIYFNAQEAYKEALHTKLQTQDENLSEMLYIYPYDPEASDKILANEADTSSVGYSDLNSNSDILSSTLSSFLGSSSNGNSSDTFNPFEKSKSSSSSSSSSRGGSFATTIDKCTKAIKLHSIKVKPRRDRSKRNDEKAKAWWLQQEFNPALKNVWLLLGKAELQNENYLQSISTFMYTTKIYSSNPEVVAECQLWIARNYTEMGWMYEAANVLYKLEANGGVPEKLKGLHASVYANYLMRNNEYDKAIPYMALAIKGEKNKTQKLRMKYILGQLYVHEGDKAKAYKAFGAVKGLSTPYKYSINASLNQLALDETKTKKEIVSKLKKYTKGKKNEPYLDKIYYTIGNVYFQGADTVNAVKNYRLAIEKSMNGGYDKTLAQIKLGGLYFDKGEYVLAQPCYSGALASLKKTNENYPLVSLRSAVLDELVVHVKVVQEQDSLQYLAKLPEEERLIIINEKIAFLKEEEKRKQKEEQYQQQMEDRNTQISEWDDLSNASLFEDLKSQKNTQSTFQANDNSAAFYFYNPQTVTQGKVSFQKQWGNRKLEDNWRRKNKLAEYSDSFSDDNLIVENDSIDNIDKSKEIQLVDKLDNNIDSPDAKEESDIYSVNYYLQQLPLTEERMKQSNDLIEDALFKMGGIYKDKLEDLYLAKEVFELDLIRYPQTENKEEIYYQLFLIYMQLDDRQMMAMYRDKLITDFSDRKYAIMLSEPNYEWNLKHMHILQDSLYDATYEAYLDSDIKTVRNNYESLQQKYPFSNLMPKFMLLNALTYAQTKDVNNLKTNLENLAKEYPDADVTALANDILSHIKEGKVLLSDGTPIRGMKWNIPYEGEEGSIMDEAEIHFADNPDSEHMLFLFYKSNTIDRNELLYEVADYNFSNYIIQTFDLSFEQDPPLEILQIKGFKKFSNIRSYLGKAFEEDGLIHRIDPSILMVPISVENSKLLLTKGLDEYIAFFKEHYGKQTPQLIAYWGGDTQIIDEYVDIDELMAEETETKENVTEMKDNNLENISEEVTLTIKPKEEVEIVSQPLKSEDKKDTNSTSINASDIFNQDQIDIMQSAGEVLNNPVDGIKGLLSKYKNREKLTKEEKEALKEERRKEKEHQKELKAIQKAQQDSIARVDKAVQDSIKQVERERIEEQKRIEAEKARIEQEKKDAIKAKAKAKEEARKQKEEERKEKKRLQDERRKTQEQERDERRKAQEKERDGRRKLQEQQRKEKEREQLDRRKAK